MTNEGQKISKSLGNVIEPNALVERYGLDPVRYFLMREVPFGNDGDFSHRAMVQRLNGDLANDFGNLAQRVLTQINRNCDAKVPQPGAFTSEDNTLLGRAKALLERWRAELGVQAIHNALIAQWEVVGEANRYVDAQAPWTLRKNDPARMATVLYVLAETLRHMAILIQPVMPEAGAKLLDQLGVAPGDRGFAALGQTLKPGAPLPKPEGVFPRYVDDAGR